MCYVKRKNCCISIHSDFSVYLVQNCTKHCHKIWEKLWLLLLLVSFARKRTEMAGYILFDIFPTFVQGGKVS